MIAKLSALGWRLVSRDRDELDWWADEIWTVESQWTPRGCTVYLTWLVDPLWDERRRPGEAVWAVGTCLQRPTTRLEAEGSPLMAINHWPSDLPEFLTSLSGLRIRPNGNRT
jgi:hypothetical protein